MATETLASPWPGIYLYGKFIILHKNCQKQCSTRRFMVKQRASPRHKMRERAEDPGVLFHLPYVSLAGSPRMRCQMGGVARDEAIDK